MKNTYGSMSLMLGAGVRLECHTYPEDPALGPILSIAAPGLTLTLSNRASGGVDAGDVENARRLLEVVTEFAAEVERLHVENRTAGPAEGAAA